MKKLRENEGGLIMSASKATPEAMAFIVKHWDWYSLCELPLMVTHKKNEENCALHSLYQWYVANFSIYII